jgi:type II secretory pathway component GspD/PulD (secretin)
MFIWPTLGTSQTAKPSKPATPPPSIEQLKRILKSRGGKSTTQTQPTEVPTTTTTTTATGTTTQTQQSTGLPTTLPAGETGIQFSFNNAPYSTVLDFIERITGLPIIGDRNIPGTLTYFSRRKMTLNEALEELNLLLQEKGVIVIRDDSRLRISKTADALRGYSVDFIGAENFLKANVPSNQIVRVFFKVNNLSAGDITTLVAEVLPVNEVKLAAWRSNNMIQVVGLSSRVKEIIQLAQKLDEGLKPAAAGLELKVFKPTYVTPSVLERMIRVLIPPSGITGPGNITLGEPGGQGPRPGPVAPSAGGGDMPLQIASDDLSGTLVIRASKGQLQEIGDIIKRLDAPQDEGNIVAVRVPIQYGTPAMIEAALNETIRQRLALKGPSNKITLTVKNDEAARSLILAGTKSVVEQAQQLIKELDKPTEAGKLQVIPLKAARADDVLRNVINPFYQSARQKISAAADIPSNSIITWATGTELEQLKELLEQLDQQAAEGKGVPTIKTYRLDQMDVNRVSATLQAMFAKQIDVTFGADPAAKTLIVAAPANKFTQIDKVVNELKGTVAEKPVTQMVKLEYANADQVANAIRGVYGTSRLPSGEMRVTISTNPQGNSILLTGNKADVDEVTSLVKQLDNDIQTASEIKTFKLSYSQSDDLAKMINDLYGGKGVPVKVVSEPWSNTLFISGAAGKLNEIEQFIKTADHAEPVDTTSNNIAFITLKTASATDAADQIDSMLGGKNAPGGAPSIDVADAGNYLIVSGQPKQIERVRQLAEQIDRMALQIPEIIAVRPIQKTSAERLSQMLSVIVPQLSGTGVRTIEINMTKGTQGLENLMMQDGITTTAPSTQATKLVVIGVDKTNNTLIIRGRPREIEQVDNAIETLTSDIDEEVQFRTYQLKFADPMDVALNVESLFNDVAAGPQVAQPQPSQPPKPGEPAARPGQQTQPQRQAAVAQKRRIRAIPVDNINSVVVRATPQDFITIEEFINQLDQSESGNLKIFKLKYARADAVAKNITDVFQTGVAARPMMPGAMSSMLSGRAAMKVSYDLMSNSVIVSASKSEFQQIEQLISAVDQPDAGGVAVHLIPIKSGSAETLAPTIQTVLSQAEQALARQRNLPMEPVSVTFEKRTNSLIVAGSDRQYEQVKQLVEKIESAKPTGQRRTFIVPLKNMDPNRAKQILDQMVPQGGRSDRNWRSNNWRDEFAYQIGTIVLTQVPTTTQATRPAVVSPRASTQPAIPLSILQQMLEANRRKKATSTTQPARVPVATTQPLPSTTIVQPGKPLLPPTTTQPQARVAEPSPQALQNLADQIKGTVDITAVPEQNALIIDASDDDYQVISQLLNMLESSSPQPQVRVFQLKNAQAREMAEVMNRLYASRPQPRGYPPITISTDIPTNSLIVSASPDIVQDMAGIIEQLDAVEQAQKMDFRVFQLKNARASQLVPQLQTMLQQILTARGIQQAPFSINADDRTNTIIVTAPETYLEQIGNLITTLDSVPSFATVSLEIVRLKQADANALGTILTTMVKPAAGGANNALLNRLELAASEGGAKVTLDLDKPIQAIPDKASQSILLLSTPENIGVLKKIVAQLDKAPMADDLLVRVFPLKYADANEASKTMRELFSKGKDLTKVPGTDHQVGVPANTTGEALVYDVIFTADLASNTLVAAGHESSLALVEVLIKQLDKEELSAFYPIRTIKLENSSPKAVATLIQDIMDARVTRAKEIGVGKASSRAKVIVKADDRTSTLLISASEEEFKSINEIVAKLDSQSSTRYEPVVIPLKHIDAEQMAEMLTKFFKERSNLKSPGMETQQASSSSSATVIIPEPRSNSLIVAATKRGLAEVNDLVAKLDNADITKKMQIAVIPLRSADASQLADAITKILSPSSSGQTGLKQAVILEFIRKTDEGRKLVQRAVKDTAFVYGDKVSNLLIALAPEETIEIIKSLAKTIDEVAPSVEMQIIALQNADASQMKEIIEELFDIGKSSSSSEAFAPMTAGAAPGAPAVAGAPAGAAGGEGGAVSRIEKETLAVAADPRTNSIIITGSASYLKMVENVVRQLDAKAVEEQPTEVIALKNAKAETIQKAVSTLIEGRIKLLQDAYGEALAPERLMEQQVTIVADEDSRKVILQASPKYFKIVRDIIEELDAAPSQVMLQAVIVEVTLDDKIEYGFEAVGQDLAFTKNQTAPGIGPNEDYVVGTDVGAAGTGIAGFSFSIRSEDFNLLLRALDSDGKLQVLSRPQILARDNAPAEISIGQQVPYPTGSSISQETGSTTTAIEYEDVGVILKVTPHINPEGFVNLEVEQEISSISTSNIQISENLTAPVFNKNAVTTIVSIKDGETVVIGGLITTTKDHREAKVPFLGDIPGLGLLFKSLTDSYSKKELLVVLTPKLMDTVQKARDISAEERDLMTLMPPELRESHLMGQLRVPPVCEDVCTTQLTPEEAEIQYETKQREACDPSKKIKAFMRTCEQ